MKLRSIPPGILLLFLLSETVAPAAYAQSAPDPKQSQPADLSQIQSKEQAEVTQIKTKCGYNADESDLKKIRKSNSCIAEAIRLRQQRLRLEDAVNATARADAFTQARNSVLNQQQIALSLKSPAIVAAPLESNATVEGAVSSGSNPSGGAAGQDDGSAHTFYGGSLSGTPSTCGSGVGINNSSLIRVHRSAMTPQTAADDFGYRLGRHFIVYQVTVENGSKDFQFMLQDVSVDFSKAFGAQPGTYYYSASSQDLSLLRGVPEKGEDLDPRNSILHVLQGIGSVAGAVSGLTAFADVMGPAVAVFNGSFLQGYTTFAPDHTGTQLNRLSDSAFSTNTVIDKQRAKSIAMFIPMDEILSHADQKQFRKDPNTFIGFDDLSNSLNAADVCVDGSFIQAVAVSAPTLSSATLASAPAPAANVDTVVSVAGTNLVGGDTMIILSGSVPATAPVIVDSTGKAGNAQVHLPADFDLTTTTATLQSKSNPTLNSGAGIKLQVAK